MVRVLLVTAACLVWLAGCSTAPKFGEADLPGSEVVPGEPPPATPAEATGTVAGSPKGTTTAGVLGTDPYDDLSLGKKQFRAANYGLAEQHYRKAVELHPNDAEAWVGLAASYDRLRRFDLADRAYKEAIRILGVTPEILNNQGFSYMLRGDYKRARTTLRQAQARDPRNPYILNNINLLEQVARKGKGVG